jgi:hypothetical protein
MVPTGLDRAGEDQKRMQGPSNRSLQKIAYPTVRNDVEEVAAANSL